MSSYLFVPQGNLNLFPDSSLCPICLEICPFSGYRKKPIHYGSPKSKIDLQFVLEILYWDNSHCSLPSQILFIFSAQSPLIRQSSHNLLDISFLFFILHLFMLHVFRIQLSSFFTVFVSEKMSFRPHLYQSTCSFVRISFSKSLSISLSPTFLLTQTSWIPFIFLHFLSNLNASCKPLQLMSLF